MLNSQCFNLKALNALINRIFAEVPKWSKVLLRKPLANYKFAPALATNSPLDYFLNASRPCYLSRLAPKVH